jgi:hypothetical protein
VVDGLRLPVAEGLHDLHELREGEVEDVVQRLGQVSPEEPLPAGEDRVMEGRRGTLIDVETVVLLEGVDALRRSEEAPEGEASNDESAGKAAEEGG